jgi:hypothetical protein
MWANISGLRSVIRDLRILQHGSPFPRLAFAGGALEREILNFPQKNVKNTKEQTTGFQVIVCSGSAAWRGAGNPWNSHPKFP